MTEGKLFIEVYDQTHQMWVEGSKDDKPSLSEIESAVLEKGYKPISIDVFKDKMMGFWRFYTKIEAT